MVAYSSLHSQTTPPVLDRDALLKELDTLSKTRKDKFAQDVTNMMTELSAARTDNNAALDLYEKAVFTVDYEGKKKDANEFHKWKQSQEATFRDETFILALKLHIEYLYYSLQKVQNPTAPPITNDILGFARDIWANEDKFNEKRQIVDPLLNSSISEGVLAKYYLMDRQLSSLQDWEKEPGKAWSIVQKTLFPAMRKNKDKTILAIWDEYITLERAKAAKESSTDRKLRYETQTEPAMFWAKSRDTIAVGNENEGISLMMTLVRQFPTHPRIEGWIKELTGILKKEPSADPGAGESN